MRHVPSPRSRPRLVSPVAGLCTVTQQGLPEMAPLPLEALRKECQHSAQPQRTHRSHQRTRRKIRTQRNFAPTTPEEMEGKKAVKPEVEQGSRGWGRLASSADVRPRHGAGGDAAAAASSLLVRPGLWQETVPARPSSGPLPGLCCGPKRCPCRRTSTPSRTMPATGFWEKS